MQLTTRFVLLSLLALTMGAPAHARLGESEAQIIERLGRPFLHQHFVWCDKDNFSANGFTIVVTLLNGQSVGETYHITRGTISEEQMAELLHVNSQGYAWNEVPQSEIPRDILHPDKRIWRRPSGSTAVFDGSSFEFKSIYLILAEEAANKPPPDR